MTARSQRLTTGKKLLFTGLLAGAAFAAGEVVVRLTKPRTDLWADTGRARGRDPKATWAHVDAFAAYSARPGRYGGEAGAKTVNAHGFISTPPLSVHKPPETTRIAFLGGSSTAGTGFEPLLTDEETWPWQVAERLRQGGRQVDFINGANSGYTSFEAYGRLWSRLRFFAPDVVVLYHGWNDLIFADPAVLEDVHRWRTHEDGSWGLYLTFPILEPRWYDHLIWPSQLLCKLRWRFAERRSGEMSLRSDRPLAPYFDEGFTEVWRQNLRLYQAACRLLGAELFVCKQATLIAPDLPPEDRARCSYEIHGFDNAAHVEAFQAFYRVIDQEVPPERVIDVTAISGRGDLFYDHIHPTPEGAGLIAQAVAARLDEELARTE